MKIIKLIFVLLLTSLATHAQENKEDTVANDFKQREVVLYEDDFGEDTVGAFPSKWQVMAGSFTWGYTDTMFHVEKDKEGMYLKIVRNAQPEFEPYPKYNLSDSFTIEIDFQLEYFNSRIACILTDDSARRWIYDSLDGKGQFKCGITHEKYGSLADKKTNIPGFDRKLWHRLAISYQKQQTKFYIDDSWVSVLTGFAVNASRVFIIPKGPVKIRHVRIAIGAEAIPIERLLSDKKFTTHAILFDVNKSAFKHTSIAFINRLAGFLKKNPSIKLEIDGHTDNDGNAAANMKLSLDRANEVKRQLVSMGIAGGRLTTKGLGASKPIDTNSTIEGKANNRRVEFISR
jgi:outer membrane protein OmpA-like peptidoglycan-associated protein